MCKKDADNNNVINISYASNALKLTFDSAQIKCKKGYYGSGTEVASGTKVKETEDYKFTAVLKSGEKVKHWVVDGRSKTLINKETYSYTVSKDDIDPNTNSITISWKKQ